MRLLDYLDNIKNLSTRLRDRPNDPDTAVGVANDCGVLIDKFLRLDYEIWRWCDYIELNSRKDIVLGRFKNTPHPSNLHNGNAHLARGARTCLTSQRRV
jgi:hypothetical protein